MKILVINQFLEEEQKNMIISAAEKVGAETYFIKSEKDITDDLRDADIIYGFGVDTAKTSKKLKKHSFKGKNKTSSGRSIYCQCRKGFGHR